MQTNKVVVKFKDETILKGKTNDFFPNKISFHLHEMNGDVKEITVEELKAVFFVKDFAGDKNYKDNFVDEIAGGGRKIRVEFRDGETVIGYTLGYSPDRRGFYVMPADLKSNNTRIFVVKSATKSIKFI